MKIFGNRILINPDPVEKIRDGIAIPDDQVGTSQFGEVIAIGDEVEKDKIEVGAKIMFVKGAFFEVDDKYIVDIPAVLCVL